MNPLMNQRSRALGLILALVATACASTQLEVGREHPASAKAETLPLERSGLLASTSSPSPAAAPAPVHAHEHASPMADTYTCPMHPEVVKNAPGKCPVCGMNLVKKESAAPRGAAH